MMRSVLVAVAAGLLCTSFGACKIARINPAGPGSDGGTVSVGGGDPRALFEGQVAGLLRDKCRSCHEGGVQGPEFLEPNAYYDSIRSFSGGRLFVPGEPDRSVLITKGPHPAAWWTAAESERVSAWIRAEGASPVFASDGGAGGGPVQTDPVRVRDGAMSIPIPGYPGSSFGFNARLNGSRLILSDLYLRGGNAGIHVTHAQIYIHAGRDVYPDSDRFANPVTFVASPGQQTTIANQATLVDFPDGGSIAIHFDRVTTTF